jgi:hypothetical protein
MSPADREIHECKASVERRLPYNKKPKKNLECKASVERRLPYNKKPKKNLKTQKNFKRKP